jgi:transposase
MSARSHEPSPITSVIAPDLDAVRRFIEDMFARGAVAALVASILALLARMRDLNTELVRKLASHSRARPPSETMRRLQLELPFLSTPAANDDGKAPLPPSRPPQKRGPKRRHAHGRPKLPPHLRRVPKLCRVPDAERICPHCHVEARCIRFKTTEKLNLVPAELVVDQIQCEIIGCPKCRRYVRTAPRPDEVIDRGLLGHELLIQAMVDHYDNAVPFERMATTAHQQRVPLSANTLASSVGRLIDVFDPVVEHVHDAALSSDYTALDATRMPVLDPRHPLGIRSGALWLIEGAHRYACFLYAPSGHDDHLEELLSGRTLGSVMCDGSPTNNCVERAGARRGGCNSHGRRKLVEALRGGDTRAAEGLALYAAIFHVDAESKRLGETIAQRFARRHNDSAPLVAELRAWIDGRRRDVEPKSKLGKAVGYLHRQWKRLTAFLRDPTMELTNNEVERDLRRWVLDRKTWLFVGHDDSARRAANALTLITTCKKLGVEPRHYLREALARILAGEKDLARILPEHFVPPSSPLLAVQPSPATVRAA